VFGDRKITLQLVRALRPCLSAAAIGYIEAHFTDDDEKNALCVPVPLPELGNWVRMMSISMANQARWSAHPELMRWLASSRLDAGLASLVQASGDEVRRKVLVERARNASRAGSANMSKLLAQQGHHVTS
jgi:hypothetical protein